MSNDLHITQYGTEIPEELVSRLADLYVADFVTPEIRKQDPDFYSRERFFDRMADYKSSPRFAVYLAARDEEIVGFASVANLIPDTAWWKGIDPPLSGEAVKEDNERTVAIFDLMVVQPRRGEGIARLMHDEILTTRREERVTLLSSEPQQPAYTMWLRWNYKIIGAKVEGGNGPRLDVFVRPRIL